MLLKGVLVIVVVIAVGILINNPYVALIIGIYSLIATINLIFSDIDDIVSRAEKEVKKGDY